VTAAWRAGPIGFGSARQTVADSDDASPDLASVTAASRMRSGLRLDVRRPRPPAAIRSNRSARALRTNPSRPARSTPSGDRSGTSPEVGSPSAHFSRVALSGAKFPPLSVARRQPAGPGRSRFGVVTSAAPALAHCTRTSAAAVSPLRFYALQARSIVALLARRTFGVGRSIVANRRRASGAVTAPQRAILHSSIEKTRLPSSSIRRAGAAGVSGLVQRTRLRRILPIEPCRSRSRRPNRVMHRRVLFSAVFRYPLLGPIRAAQPDEGFFPRAARRARVKRRAHASHGLSPGGAPGVSPFAGLLPHSGGHAEPAHRRERRLNQ